MEGQDFTVYTDHKPIVVAIKMKLEPQSARQAKEDLEASPTEMVYGSTLTVPGDFFQTGEEAPVSDHFRALRQRVDDPRPIPTSTYGAEKVKYRVPASLEVSKYVFVHRGEAKRPLQPPYTGPYLVFSKQPKWFNLQIGSKEEKIWMDRLKPAWVAKGDIEVAQPPRRGRPPASRPAFDNDQLVKLATRGEQGETVRPNGRGFRHTVKRGLQPGMNYNNDQPVRGQAPQQPSASMVSESSAGSQVSLPLTYAEMISSHSVTEIDCWPQINFSQWGHLYR